MTTIVFDTESDGFVLEATKIHCLCLKELGKGLEVYHDGRLVRTGSIKEGLKRLESAEELVCHNQAGHDLPLLKKLYDWEPPKDTKITDTYALSMLFNPDRKPPYKAPSSCGAHSLEAWGYRVGVGKVSHEDWSKLSYDMLHRCKEDVNINEIAYFALLAEKGNWNWDHAIEIETNVLRIISEQANNGVVFNFKLAEELIEGLEESIDKIDSDLLRVLPKRCVIYGKSVLEPFTISGRHKKISTSWFEDADGCPVSGPFSRVTWEDINLGSMAQVKNYLLTKTGWKPTEWNFKDGNRTSPKLTEDSFESIGGDVGKLIKDRYLFRHRKSQIQGWISRLRPDGRLSAAAITCGTNTRRFRHINVVNVPKAKPSVYLGCEMRSLFMAGPGRVLVGYDASALELRLLGHYMGDEDFITAVIHGKESEGTDIHTFNQRLAGLLTRDDAKTFIYAFLYGAGDEKLGSIVNGGASEGAALRRKFLRNLPSLDRLLKLVKRRSKKGYLTAIDGSKIFMRTDSEGHILTHKALNTLLQASGAILMKETMVILDEGIRKNGLDIRKVIDMHDESQASVAPKDVEKYKELAQEAIVQAGLNLGISLPMAAEVKTGNNWAETH